MAAKATKKPAVAKKPAIAKKLAVTKKPAVAKKRKLFTLKAPDAGAVSLVGSFNDWTPGAKPLIQGTNGVWKTSLTLTPGVYEYRYVVDGEWCDDPQCDEHSANDFGSANCLVRV